MRYVKLGGKTWGFGGFGTSSLGIRPTVKRRRPFWERGSADAGSIMTTREERQKDANDPNGAAQTMARVHQEARNAEAVR